MLRALLVIIAFLPGLASAADLLKRSDVENFMNASRALEALGDKYPDATEAFDVDLDDAKGMMSKMVGSDGSIQLMSVVMQKAMQHPQMSREILGLVKGAGFGSLDDFTSIGNRVFAAAMRAETSDSDLAEMMQMADLAVVGDGPEILAELERLLAEEGTDAG